MQRPWQPSKSILLLLLVSCVWDCGTWQAKALVLAAAQLAHYNNNVCLLRFAGFLQLSGATPLSGLYPQQRGSSAPMMVSVHSWHTTLCSVT